MCCLRQLSYFFNPLPAKLSNLYFHPFKFVSVNRDPQLQVGENKSYSFNLGVTSYHKYCIILCERIIYIIIVIVFYAP